MSAGETTPDGGLRVPMRMRMAMVVLAYGGRAPSRALRRIALAAGYTGTREGRSGYSAAWAKAVYDFTKDLKDQGLLVREGDDWVAPDIGALMDWVSDYVDRTLDYADKIGSGGTP